MPTTTIKPSQYAAYMRKLAKEFMPAAKRGVLSGALRCLPELQRRTSEAKPANPAGIGSGGAVNTRAFLQAWRATPLSNGASVSNTRTYAGVIEEGRRKGGKMPPNAEIMHWAQRRLGISAQEAKNLAYPIALAIAKRGLKPRRVLSGSIAVLTRIVNTELKAELDRAIAGMHP